MQKFTVRTLTLCALFVALTAVCSQIAIPMAPVPINLANFAVFLSGALVVGLFCKKFGCKTRALIPGMIAGAAVCYLLGTAWFMALTGTGFAESLLLCVVPFLIGDALKIALAALVAPQLVRLLARAKTA